MILAELPGWVVDLGAAAGVLTAVIVCLGLLWRLRLVRWVYAHLIGSPFTDWVARTVGTQTEPVRAELAELRRTQEATDMVVTTHMNAEELRQLQDARDRTEQQRENRAFRAEIRNDVRALLHGQRHHADRLAAVEAAVRDPQPDP